MQLVEICIYPIKSCQGISLAQSPISSRGLRWDREWMIVTQDGVMLTQRQNPKLATIQLELKDQKVALKTSESSHLFLTTDLNKMKTTKTVQIWKDQVQARFEPEVQVHDFLSEVLSQKVMLVRAVGDEYQRKISSRSRFSDIGIGFPDQQPLLVTTRQSLMELNQHLTQKIPMSRFRPNLVIDGASRPYAEDEWNQLKIEDLMIELTQNCSRCMMVNIDQSYGVKASNEPLQVLAQSRKFALGVMFGRHGLTLAEGEVRLFQNCQIIG